MSESAEPADDIIDRPKQKQFCKTKWNSILAGSQRPLGVFIYYRTMNDTWAFPEWNISALRKGQYGKGKKVIGGPDLFTLLKGTRSISESNPLSGSWQKAGVHLIKPHPPTHSLLVISCENSQRLSQLVGNPRHSHDESGWLSVENWVWPNRTETEKAKEDVWVLETEMCLQVSGTKSVSEAACEAVPRFQHLSSLPN